MTVTVSLQAAASKQGSWLRHREQASLAHSRKDKVEDVGILGHLDRSLQQEERSQETGA